ncbi:MAG: TfuA domain-containing protein [Rhodospirillales bacterium]|nr:TfuA domain-containing protein [Rhodospirillales bacterium]
MTELVFLGPTLAAEEAVALIEAEILPPARQGDLYRAVRARRPRAIGLIDGVFRNAPAVWHREILWALASGVHVFGAASMGALRAAELAPFGMRGVGRIFEAYRDGRWPGLDAPFEDDDEVAVMHAPLEAGGFALSDAMVDLRATLAAAEAAGVVSRAASAALAAEMKRRHFSERSLAALAEAANAALGKGTGTWIAAHPERIKEQDALAMLRAMAAFLATRPAPFRPAFRFTPALVWQRFVAAAEAEAAGELARAVWDDWLPGAAPR